jgi:hypothetical protein
MYVCMYVCMYILWRYIGRLPVSMAERSKACTVYDHLNNEIAALNPAWGMDACLRVSVLCCLV